jgi:DNA (cytosine-5)-methyltransferase 1
MTKRVLKTVSLFSGGMGLDIGLHKTGYFQHLCCVEADRACCATIRKNRDSGRLALGMRVIENDIKKVDPRQLRCELGLEVGELDALIGGPPCQSFSTAGRRGTTQDPRGMLLWDFLRFVDEFRPKFFLMENVRGLLSAASKHREIARRPDKGGRELSEDEQPGSVVKLFCEDLRSMTSDAYHLDCFEVNAANYGAPQIRERAIFIGNRFNLEMDFPNPSHGNFEQSAAPDMDGMLPFDLPARLKPWATLRDAIGDLSGDAGEVLDFSPRKKDFLDKVPPGSNWRSLAIELQKQSMGAAWHAKGGRSGWWRRLTFDLPSPTLVTLPNHASTSLCHPEETRALSLKEYARIQEFPDEWEFVGTLAERYAQVGNAVPIRLAKLAGSVVAQGLINFETGLTKPSSRPLPVFRKIYIQSHVRTRRWFKDGQTLVWDVSGPSIQRYSTPKTLRKTRALET